MSTSLAPNVFAQYLDDNGEVLAGGKIYTYVAGTSTPAATYTDYDGLTPNTNPIVLDAAGRPSSGIWLGTGLYKFILKDANDVTLDTVDNVAAAGSGSATTAPWTEHAITDGMAAANLTGETVDFATYSSALYECEIIRGTTVISAGHLSVQNLNGTGRVVTGSFMSTTPHGVTFTVSQAGTVCQLRAATDTGAGAGTIKLRRNLIAI
jgi:hypothetical protein